MRCPLCQQNQTAVHFEREDPRDGPRRYHLCPCCGLVFLDPVLHLDAVAEKARYDTHNNHPDDEGYVNFLNRLAEPLLASLPAGAYGLDFGCGPGPTLSLLLERAGHRVENYDPIYFPQESLLERTYDFVACTEVVEHLYRPRDVFLAVSRMLKRPNGLFAVMTQLLEDPEAFAGWWYHRDPTHVCFYQRRTFAWISSWLGWQVASTTENVIIFRSPP